MAISSKVTKKLAGFLAVALLAFNASCDFHLSPPPAATLAVCPSDQTQSTSSILGALGGLVSLDGSSVLVPAGALLSSTTIALTLPASQYMEIGVTANGGHFLFQQPIAITIDYSRCSPDIQQKTLTVWNIDPDTHRLLQKMGGIDNKLTHQITFSTIHLSGYAIAY
ncbi:MAG TPA: hypothetical protein VJN70_11970 [Gemmatimonadaceae bacterium]|nr:hypothetical protein [Gemmatimonadaceae bacterium]